MAPECTSTPIKKSHDASGMVVVANRLPFVLKRDEDGILHRKARYLVNEKNHTFYHKPKYQKHLVLAINVIYDRIFSHTVKF